MTQFFKKWISPHLVPLATLILLTLAVYARILGHDFQIFWDDDKYVTANEAVRAFTFENIKVVFTSFYTGNYAPVQMLSYMVDHAFWGMRPSGFLLTNLLVHASNGVLFYFILIRMGLTRLAAFVAGFIFLVHPVQVESVAWVSERKNLLAIFFSLVSFSSFLSYRERGRHGGKGFYLISLSAFTLALLAKSVVVVFPLVLLLHGFCFRERLERRPRLLDKLPFALAAAIMVWITMQGQLPGEVPGAGGGRADYHGGSPYATFLTMLPVLGQYLKLLFWPAGLAAIYDPPIKTAVDFQVAGAAVVAASLAALGVFLLRRQRRLFFCYALFFIGLLPVSQVVPIVTLMNDRYLYLPMLGAAACFGALVLFAERQSGALRTVMLIATGGVLLALPVVSYQRAGVWRNDLTLWRDAAEKSPRHHVALYGLAQALHNSGDLDAALPIYLQVLKKNPRHLDTLTHLGLLYSAKRMHLQARPYLLDITRYYPSFAQGFMELGSNYYATDEIAAAEQAFKSALTLQPGFSEATLHLGIISLRTRKIDAARKYLNDAVAIGGTSAVIEYNQACVEALGGAPQKALRHLENSMRLGWNDRGSLQNDPDLASIRALPEFRNIIAR